MPRQPRFGYCPCGKRALGHWWVIVQRPYPWPNWGQKRTASPPTQKVNFCTRRCLNKAFEAAWSAAQRLPSPVDWPRRTFAELEAGTPLTK